MDIVYIGNLEKTAAGPSEGMMVEWCASVPLLFAIFINQYWITNLNGERKKKEIRKEKK